MPGLLDDIATDPSQRAITAIGAGLLGVRRGQEGQAILGGLNAYDQALANQQHTRRADAQMQEQSLRMQQLRQQLADQDAQRLFFGDPSQLMNPAMPAVPGGMDMAESAKPATPRNSREIAQRLMASGNPALVQQGYAMLTKQDAPIKLNENERMLVPDGKGGFTTLVDSKPDPTKSTELAKLIGERDKYPPGHPLRGIYDQQILKLTTHAPGTNVTVGLQAPYAGIDAQGRPIVLQPANKPGAPPQLLTDPRDNRPIRPPSVNQPLDAAAAKQITGIQSLKSAITEYTGALDKWGKFDTLNPNQRAEMGVKYNNMMLQAKEAYNLGVLNGPDFKILTSVVTDPRSLQGAVTSNSSLKRQATELSRIMGDVETKVRQVHGRQNPAAQSDARADTPADSQAATMRFNAATGKLERVQQ